MAQIFVSKLQFGDVATRNGCVLYNSSVLDNGSIKAETATTLVNSCRW
jgi:hypothetical protein